MGAGPVGGHYRLDYSDMLVASTNWQSLTSFTTMGTIVQMSDTSPPGSHTRFYRAVMMP